MSVGKPAPVKRQDDTMHQVLKLIISHFLASGINHLNLELFIPVAVELQTEAPLVWIWPDTDSLLEHIVALNTIINHNIGKPRCGTA